MKTARDVLRKNVISVTPNTPVTEVARVLNENGISGCPVIDLNGVLRGVISRTNILDFALRAESGTESPVLRLLIPGTAREDEVYAPGADLDEIPEAQDLMAQEVLTVGLDTPIHEVARLMSGERIHRVPVMDGEKVVGIITSIDLLEAWPAPAPRQRSTARS